MSQASNPDKVAFLNDSDDGEIIEIRIGPNEDVSFETESEVLCRVWPEQLLRALQALGFSEFKLPVRKKKP